MAGLGKEITEVGQDGSLLEEQNPTLSSVKSEPEEGPDRGQHMDTHLEAQNPSLSSVTSEPDEGPDRGQHVHTHSSENSGKIPL